MLFLEVQYDYSLLYSLLFNAEERVVILEGFLGICYYSSW